MGERIHEGPIDEAVILAWGYDEDLPFDSHDEDLVLGVQHEHYPSLAKLVFPRPKTGVPRRAKLWPETVDAIQVALKNRPEPKDPDDADYIFITKMKYSWAKETAGNNPVSLMFRKMLHEEELHRQGVGFYSLRRTFETVAGETLDQPAVDLVMGHTPDSNDMAARYRQRVGDDRLEKVVEHVRKWLFEKDEKAVAKKMTPVKKTKRVVKA